MVLIAVGLLAALASTATAASYSKGQSGAPLKWLPHRPASVQDEAVVTATGYSTPSSATRPLRTAQNPEPKSSSSPFYDPFGDDKKDMPPPPAEALDNGPKPREALPGLDLNGSLDMDKPYGAPEGLTPFAMPEPDKNSLSKPLLEQEFAPRQHEFREGCPSPEDLKDIAELTTNITPPEGDLPRDCPLGHATFQPRSFASVTYTWTASGLCHKPLYFEDVQLERYGHMVGPFVQPLASAAHFFLTFPILPYKMGLETPNECMYSLGYYRPGDCAPYLFDPIPLSVRGALFEAGAWIGGVYAIP